MAPERAKPNISICSCQFKTCYKLSDLGFRAKTQSSFVSLGHPHALTLAGKPLQGLQREHWVDLFCVCPLFVCISQELSTLIEDSRVKVIDSSVFV